MAETFKCPQCGGPISFEPEPGDKTVACSFCGETVIIPEELRIALPPPMALQPAVAKVPWWRNWIVIGVLLIAIFSFGDMVLQALTAASPGYVPIKVSVETADAIQVATELAQSQATFEAKSSLRAEATAAAESTLQAVQPVIAQEQSWPVLLKDDFSGSTQAWDVGDVKDNYLTGSRNIKAGKYVWAVTSVSSAFVYSYPKTLVQKDFLASVDLKYNAMPADPSADAGLVLRANDTDSAWYYYSVNDKGEYCFGWYDGKEWNMLIPDTATTVFKPGQTNRLSIGVQGEQFIFLINGQVVGTFKDASLKAGNIGVGVNLPQADQKANFEFSNFSILAPTSAP
jgi:hypothetical protein